MSKYTKTCRICLEDITDSLHWYLLNYTIQEILLDFFPEIDLNYVDDAVVCLDCISSVETVNKFKNTCIRTEGIIMAMREQEISFDNVQTFIQERDIPVSSVIFNKNTDTKEEFNVISDYDVQINTDSSKIVDETGAYIRIPSPPVINSWEFHQASQMSKDCPNQRTQDLSELPSSCIDLAVKSDILTQLSTNPEISKRKKRRSPASKKKRRNRRRVKFFNGMEYITMPRYLAVKLGVITQNSSVTTGSAQQTL